MDEVPSLSDILTDSNSDESSSEDIDRKSEASDVVDVKLIKSVPEIECDDSKSHNLILDLQKLNGMNDFQNEEDNYEKLSEVIEEPEDITDTTIILDDESTTASLCGELSDKNAALKERITSLSIVIFSLRDELKQEVSLWREEREEFQIIQEKSDLIALDEATAAARAAAEAYAAESPLSEDRDGLQYNYCNFTAAGEILDVNPEQTLSELTILEYEKKLAKYQDALALAQAEKRYNMRRQLAANTYRQKLIEVERLCDEELEKIKQNAISLQPLKQMVSQWYKNDPCGGDAAEEKSPLLHFSLEKSYSRSNYRRFSTTGNKVDAEVNMAPEIFVAKFDNFDENNDFSFSKGNGSRIRDNDLDRCNIARGVDNTPLSLKWESSNYTL